MIVKGAQYARLYPADCHKLPHIATVPAREEGEYLFVKINGEWRKTVDARFPGIMWGSQAIFYRGKKVRVEMVRDQ